MAAGQGRKPVVVEGLVCADPTVMAWADGERDGWWSRAAAKVPVRVTRYPSSENASASSAAIAASSSMSSRLAPARPLRWWNQSIGRMWSV